MKFEVPPYDPMLSEALRHLYTKNSLRLVRADDTFLKYSIQCDLPKVELCSSCTSSLIHVFLVFGSTKSEIIVAWLIAILFFGVLIIESSDFPYQFLPVV